MNSTATRNGILALAGDQVPNVVTLTGDFSYADDYSASRPDDVLAAGVGGVAEPRWDTFVRLMEPLLSRFPLIHVAGNHEMEGGAGCFISGNGVNWLYGNYVVGGTPPASLLFTAPTWPTVDFGPLNPCFQAAPPPPPHRVDSV